MKEAAGQRAIIDQLAEFTAQTPNSAILYDEAHGKGITYAQLDDMSGRIYAAFHPIK